MSGTRWVVLKPTLTSLTDPNLANILVGEEFYINGANGTKILYVKTSAAGDTKRITDENSDFTYDRKFTVVNLQNAYVEVFKNSTTKDILVDSIIISNTSDVNPLQATVEIGSDYSLGEYTKKDSIGTNINLDAGSAVDILKKFKVLKPGAALLVMSSVANKLQVMVNYRTLSVNTNYRIGNVDVVDLNETTLYSNNTTDTLKTHSILIANDSLTDSAKVDIYIKNSSDVLQGYIVKNYLVPMNTTVEVLEHYMILKNNESIFVKTSHPNSIEVTSVFSKI